MRNLETVNSIYAMVSSISFTFLRWHCLFSAISKPNPYDSVLRVLLLGRVADGTPEFHANKAYSSESFNYLHCIPTSNGFKWLSCAITHRKPQPIFLFPLGVVVPPPPWQYSRLNRVGRVGKLNQLASPVCFYDPLPFLFDVSLTCICISGV